MANCYFEADFTGVGTNWTSCTPKNYKDTKLQVIFTSDYPSATLQSIPYEFVNTADQKDADNVNNFIARFGVNQGIPYRIRIGTNILFYGVIDIAHASCQFEQDTVKAPLKKIGSIDWFMDLAEAASFRAMYDAGLFSPPAGDPGYNPSARWFYKKIPYSLTFRDLENALMLFLQEVTLIQHVYKASLDTSNDISTMIAAYGTDVAQAGTSSPTALQSTITLAEQVIYDGILIVSLVGLTENLINQTVGVTKYKYCMLVNDLINAGLYYINNILGSGVPYTLTFDSTIFSGRGYGGIYKNTAIIPKKNIKPVTASNGSLGLPVIEDYLTTLAKGGVLTTGNEAIAGSIGPPYGYQDGTLKKLFTDLKQVFNGAVKISGSKVQFEEQHFWNNIASYTLPNTETPKPGVNWFGLPRPDSHNWQELAFNYMVRFQTDSSDEMTLKNYKGTTAMCQIQPKVIRNVLFMLPPPSTDIILPFALAKRKEAYNFAEQMVLDILTVVSSVVNGFVSVINGLITGINYILAIFSTSIPLLAYVPPAFGFNRIGWLEVSNDSFSTPKIFIADPQSSSVVHIISDFTPSGVPQFLNSNGQPENPMSAAALMGTPANNQFHGMNLATRGNQWLLYKNKTIPMCATDFLNLINNTNIFTVPDGNGGFIYGKFEKILWNIYNDQAVQVEYRINKTYDNAIYEESLNFDGN